MSWFEYVLPFLPIVPMWVYIIITIIDIRNTPTTVEELQEYYAKKYL